MIGLVATGGGTTLILNYQDIITINNNKFGQPFIQVLMMFLGEILCFLINFIKQLKRKKTGQ